MLAKALGWAVLVVAWPIVRWMAWLDERTLEDFEDLERDVRRDV